MAQKTQHVLKNISGGWSVKKGGAKKATKIFPTQKEAISEAREIAKKQHAELYIHGKDGRIIKKNSYGNDPCPPKDKK